MSSKMRIHQPMYDVELVDFPVYDLHLKMSKLPRQDSPIGQVSLYSESIVSGTSKPRVNSFVGHRDR